MNHNFNSRRSNSLSCCISHSHIIYNGFLAYKSTVEPNESTVSLRRKSVKYSPFNSY